MSIEYTTVEGPLKAPEITMYSISYCDACKSAKQFLTNQGYTFRYVYIDLLPEDESRRMRMELQGDRQTGALFPVLELNSTDRLYGFIQILWERRLKKDASS